MFIWVLRDACAGCCMRFGAFPSAEPPLLRCIEWWLAACSRCRMRVHLHTHAHMQPKPQQQQHDPPWGLSVWVSPFFYALCHSFRMHAVYVRPLVHVQVHSM